MKKIILLLFSIILISNNAYSKDLNCSYFEKLTFKQKIVNKYWKIENHYRDDGINVTKVFTPDGQLYGGGPTESNWFIEGGVIFIETSTGVVEQHLNFETKKGYTLQDKEKISEYKIIKSSNKKNSTECNSKIKKNEISNKNTDNNQEDSIKDKLKKLKTLFEDDLITQDEYDAKRKEILDAM